MRLRRIVADRLLISFSFAAVIIAIVPLASILFDVTAKGITAINWDFFTMLPPTPLPGAVGGLGNAIQGTLILVSLASAIGLPVGLFSGVYISEYGGNWYGSSIRFLGDVLVGNPSIVFGIMGYVLLVLPLQSYNTLAGGFALGVMMMPIISNTTAEALKLVPNSLREASMALGVRKWRTTFVIISNARAAVATGALLAVARVMGETAPLILTAGISTLWFSGLNQPAASLTYYIYYFATSPFPNWVSLAWGAAFVLIVTIMIINVAVRVVTRGARAHA